MTGVFGATLLVTNQAASVTYSNFASAVWPSPPVGQAAGMKFFYNGTVGVQQMSDGSGTSRCFPTSLGSGETFARNNGFQAVIAVFKPWVNLSLSSWDSTTGSADGTSASTTAHGGTGQDWAALSACVSALNTAFAAKGVTLYVHLWQETERWHAPASGGGMNWTPKQYWSMLSWYGNAVTGSVASGGANLPRNRLLHSCSASYAGQMGNFFPANQGGGSSGPNAALAVGGAVTDFYSRTYVTGYRLNAPFSAGGTTQTPITTLCANAGIPYMGIGEFGIGDSSVPDNANIYAFLNHINTVAASYPDGLWWWFGESEKSAFGEIPGYASGQAISNPPPRPAQNPGPDCTPYLRTLAATLTGNALTVTTSSLPGGTVGAPYSVTLATNGGGSGNGYTWSMNSGSLPPGLSLHPSTGRISGTPTTASPSPPSFTVSVSDSAGNTAISGPLSVTVAGAALVVTTTLLPPAAVGVPYSAALSASNGTPPYSWALATGSLPPGLTLGSGGLIHGTPTAANLSPTAFTVTATDSATPTPGTATSGPLSITVNAAPLVITTTSAQLAGTAGVTYSVTLGATGGVPVYSWTALTTLPAGFSLSTGGVLSCTDPAAGTAPVTFQVTDSNGTATQNTLTLAIASTVPSTTRLMLRVGGSWVTLNPQTLSGGQWQQDSVYTAVNGAWT